MRYVLDASAILRFVDKEPGFVEVAKLVKEANRGGIELFVSAANWAEVLHVALKALGQKKMEELNRNLQLLPWMIVPVDIDAAKRAAELRFQFKLAYADSFAASLADDKSAALVTADHDFLVARGKLKVQMLPTKGKATTP